MRLRLGGGDGNSVLILAYHAISDLGTDSVLADYGVTPEMFDRQLDGLAAAGWRFVDLDTVDKVIDGTAGALPRKAVLVTFDDAYTDVFETALPVLAARSIPAVVFAVAGLIGEENAWDIRRGGRPLRLMSAEQHREAAAKGVETGSHTLTHPALPQLTGERLEAELSASADAIAALGLPRPRALAYPGGLWSPAVAAAAAKSYGMAFTTAWGAVRKGSRRYELPRVEVLARDDPRTLRAKLAVAGAPRSVVDSVQFLLGLRARLRRWDAKAP